MALATAVKGGLRPSQVITWTRADGQPETLTGATLTGHIRNRSTGATRAIAGVLSVTDDTGGAFRWDYATGDVAEAGKFYVQFTAAFLENPTPAKTFVAAWTIQDSLA